MTRARVSESKQTSHDREISWHYGEWLWSMRNMSNEKSQWSGEINAVQPRIRLLRSFDERHHAYLG